MAGGRWRPEKVGSVEAVDPRGLRGASEFPDPSAPDWPSQFAEAAHPVSPQCYRDGHNSPRGTSAWSPP
jgi:hypothetical protein